MRKSMDGGGVAQRFLVFQMIFACFFLSIAEPLRQENIHWSFPVAGMGIMAGILLAIMLFLLGKALTQGPAGLTFSLLSSAAVMPGIVMAFWFGKQWGFVYTSWHAIGSFLVLIGLFWGGKSLGGFQNRKIWFYLAGGMFLCHILLLSLFQWRAFLLHLPRPEEIVSFISFESLQSPWFLSIMFASAGFVQWLIYQWGDFGNVQGHAGFYGVLGGIASGLANFALICSIEKASSLEHAVVFPIFSVATIVVSNLWSQRLYQEQVNWRACYLCLLGIIIGTVDWQSFL